MTSSKILVWRLVASQATSMTASNIITVSSSLAALTLTAQQSLATLAIAIQLAFMMLATVPASMLMARYGRRRVFVVGALAGMAGALISAGGLWVGQFLLFCAGAPFLGIANAIALYYRFAAADIAEPAYRPRAISLVMGGGVFAALFGAEIAVFGRDLLLPTYFVGTYLIIAGLQLANAVAISTIPLPKPPPARFTAGRPMREIARDPFFAPAVACGMIGYGVMAYLMTATPLAMAGCGLAFSDSAFVIQWHVLAMYAPSFFTGRLIEKFGLRQILAAGLVFTGLAVVLDLSGEGLWHFWSGLFALGIGWNFLFVGGTTLVTRCHRPEEKAKVQAVNDLAVFATTAVLSLAAGALQSKLGWAVVNWTAVPALLVVLIYLASRWRALKAA